MLFQRSRILIAVCLCLVALLMLCTTACDTRKAPLHSDLDFSEVDPATCKESATVTNYVKLSVSIRDDKDAEPVILDDIIIRLYPEVAPQTVENFQNLVSQKFYDGLTFHRIYKGFMIQGGDPKGDGTGGSEHKIKGEFNANGFENNLKHVSGVISMARNPSSFDSASSQFFIMHKSNADLNGSYAAFGYVVAGLDVVDQIAKVPVKQNSGGELSDPLKIVTIESIRFVQPE